MKSLVFEQFQTVSWQPHKCNHRYPRRRNQRFTDEPRALEQRTKSVTALQEWIAAPPLDRAIEGLKLRVREAFGGDRRDRPYDDDWRVLRRGVERC